MGTSEIAEGTGVNSWCLSRNCFSFDSLIQDTSATVVVTTSPYHSYYLFLYFTREYITKYEFISPTSVTQLFFDRLSQIRWCRVFMDDYDCARSSSWCSCLTAFALYWSTNNSRLAYHKHPAAYFTLIGCVRNRGDHMLNQGLLFHSRKQWSSVNWYRDSKIYMPNGMNRRA